MSSNNKDLTMASEAASMPYTEPDYENMPIEELPGMDGMVDHELKALAIQFLRYLDIIKGTTMHQDIVTLTNKMTLTNCSGMEGIELVFCDSKIGQNMIENGFKATFDGLSSRVGKKILWKIRDFVINRYIREDYDTLEEDEE
jgi:hypothetical protein